MAEFVDDEEDEEPGFLKKFGIWIGLGVVVLVGAGIFLLVGKGEKKPARPKTQMTMISLPPSPPPPPPPPEPEPPEPEEQEEPEESEEEMVVQDEVAEPEPIAEPEPEAPPDEPMGTSIEGDGPPDGFGLSGSGSGMRIGGSGSGGGGGGGGTKWGNFAARVQSTVMQALRSDKRSKSLKLNATEVRVWADSSGRITRVSGGGVAADVLKGLKLPEPPPDDMPMPIVMKITAKRPN